MLPIQIGLTDTTGSVDAATLASVAAAINTQVTRDLPQFWTVQASVQVLTDPASVPAGVWPVQIVAQLDDNAGGYHLADNNQPYAKVLYTPGSDEWTVAASHEVIEMLVDPYGNKLQAAAAMQIVNGAIVPADGQFEYLVEACDPCEADAYTYQIDTVRVSDFITPSFYDAQSVTNARYSFTGAITQPMQILPGGYISWTDPATNNMMQILWLDGTQPPELRNLGSANGAALRLFVENNTHPLVRKIKHTVAPHAAEAHQARKDHRAMHAAMRAKRYV